ncbi:Serine/threonine-protein phosphatase 6 regulatory subunit 2 [Tupaia chinensis]|uniref:Serine/threonine-protein phosphatase 6 regulatory subunit 2 n=1 Tax=Tupaia chinensis TaxID=246437 RepID=L9JIT0_TUPCH|nr:Serine/threonine-protein phosphatase 6 regulatory subunit 2 [Tupaia chinensis]
MVEASRITLGIIPSEAITMFWKFDLNTASHVDKLLDKEHVTLQELMDEDDILQECKAQNRKLLDFLCRQQCMEQLVSLITQDPPLDMEEKVRFKYPNTACELLTCDVPQISDRLGGDESLLSLLYDFLDREPPLNPLLASFFSKTIGNLIARKTEQVIMFLKKKDKFISLVLTHIGTSALMDLLLRLVSCVEPAGLRQEVLHWLNEEKIIQRLVELIHPSQDEDRQSNASQTLCDIIRLGRDQSNQLQEAPESDPLLTVLESVTDRQGCVEQLLKNMFDGDQTESCLVSGTQVLLTLLETRRAGTEGLVDSFSQGLERSYTVSSSVLHGIEPRLKDFHQLLLSPPKKKAILTTIGVLEEPLGNARLHGARLMAALLHTNTPSINQELCRLNTMDLLLDLFFKYTWNNFLHFQVELCIAAILSHAAREERAEAGGPESRVEPPHGNGNGNRSTEAPPAAAPPENIMVTHLFQKCCLVQRILEAWEANDRTQAAGGMRRGNMGHLTRIANAVVQNLERGPMQTHISEVIRDCRGRWESFVEETLTETNRKNTVDLVSTHHLPSSSEDEDIEGAFPNELSLQQAFSEYQIQQMTANFVDQFGFNDEEFADQDDNIKNVTWCPPGNSKCPLAARGHPDPLSSSSGTSATQLSSLLCSAPFDRVAEINFNIDADEDSPSTALFEACCSDRIQPFDDEEEDDIWQGKEVHCATRGTARARFGAPHVSESHSIDLEHRGRNGKTGSETDRDTSREGTPPAPVKNEVLPMEGESEGTAWMAVFDEPGNITAATPRVAKDPSTALFEACCSDRIQPFDDEEEDDIWQGKEVHCATRGTARARFGAPHVSESHSIDLEHRGRNGKTGSETDRDTSREGTPPAPVKNEVLPMEGESEGTAWMAVFDEPGNITAATPRVAKDVGSSVWAASATAPEEKGWAKFTDFQPFCCSESRPRCSSPVDIERSHAEDGQSQGSEKAFGPASPCAWNVCVTRKAPLVASDSSSSGGSDSEEDEQKAASTLEAVSRGPGRETPLLPRTVEAVVGRADHTDSRQPDPVCPAPAEVNTALAMATTTTLSKAGSPVPAASAMAVEVPPGPIMAVTTAAPAIVAGPGPGDSDKGQALEHQPG